MKKIVVLNVNGDDAVRFGLSQQLQLAGFEVREASTGAEALAKAAAGPDLLLIGGNLPDMTRLEISQKLQVDPLEAAMAVTAERSRMATEAASIGIFDWDLATGALALDSLCSKLVGLRDARDIDHDAFVQCVHPEDRPRVEAATAAALTPESDGAYDVEYRTVSIEDGSERWVTSRGRVQFSVRKPIRMIGTVIDITAAKRAECECSRLLAETQKAHAEAERSNRIKDEFLATVSHELRTPLTSILGWARLLRAGTLPPERSARGLETIERNALAQTQLIDDLLDVSRIVAGNMRLAVAKVDLARVVEAALEVVRPAADAKGVRLQSVAVTTGAHVMGDPDRLQQVVWNLLTNAVKFTPCGGRVLAQVRQHESHAEICIEDTGEGISREFTASIFNRFQQEHGGAARKHGGLGLGLAIVRHLVGLHGGTIRAESEGEGKGAAFIVRIPVASAMSPTVSWPPKKPTPSPADGLACPPALAGLRVLVVDDEPDARDLLASVLGLCEAKVTTVSSAAEARHALSRADFDVLVSDIGMPGEDGYALIREVRRWPANQGGEIPALALTAYARALDRTQALQAGFDLHAAKPIDPAELLACLAQIVRARRLAPSALK